MDHRREKSIRMSRKIVVGNDTGMDGMDGSEESYKEFSKLFGC
jgi:hypothetical protein